MQSPDDLRLKPQFPPRSATAPMAEPIQLASVYRCHDPAEADAILSGREPGYIYRRDGHPNADLLADKCRQLHSAEKAAICGSGMAALAAIVLAHVRSGEHIVAARQLYGRSLRLLMHETERLGIRTTLVDTCDLPAVESAITRGTRLLIAETITNPTLRVSDIASLAEIAHRHGVLLVIDNTFACPIVCRPIELGADLVFESLTKIMNGHSDVLLGAVCGAARHWERISEAIVTWGLVAAPFDCWLAGRGLGTLALRVDRAGSNALIAAKYLEQQASVERVLYPGLGLHCDHDLARRQFADRFGAMVTFTLKGDLEAATRFIRAARRIPFSPSLGELSTTLSHPRSTSHRALSDDERRALGITGGTIRLSLGIESSDFVIAALEEGLAAV